MPSKIAAILADVRMLPPEDVGTLRLAILAARLSVSVGGDAVGGTAWTFFNALSEALDCDESRAGPAYGALYRLYTEPSE